MSKKVYLKAYFRKNIGDDMFVETVLRRYPNVRFRAYARPIDLPKLKEEANLRLVPSWRRFVDRVLIKLRGKKPATNGYEKRADATVHIGGSIFIEPTNFKKPARFYYPENMFYIGCNFGPCRTAAYHDFIETRLKKATDVCFRDTASRDEFAHLETVRQAPDVLFGYAGYPERKKGNGIGISVIDMTERPELKDAAQDYETAVAAFIDECKKRDIPVTLFGFCGEEGDTKAIDRILARSASKAADRCEYQGDIAAFLERFNACEYILATRFHAMVIGWALGKNVLPVIYSHKQTTVIRDAGYDGVMWDVKRSAHYDAHTLLTHLTQSRPPKKTEQLIRESETQFAALDAFVNA